MPEAVTIVGLDALARDFARMDKDSGFRSALQAAGMKALEPAAGAARSAVPHETGSLAASIEVGHNRLGATLRMTRDYAGPVDFGGYPGDRPYRASGRYLFPAARSVAGKVQSLYEAGVQRALDSYGWTNQGGSAHD
jgi:hypothetical protein